MFHIPTADSWQLPDGAELVDAAGDVRERLARQRDVPASFTPDVLATFEREPELIDIVALHLLDRHFAPGLHEEILEAVGLELGALVATRPRDMAFRAAVLEAYLAECCVCGFSLRLVDGLIGVDAAHIRWHAHGGPDKVPNGLALCALHRRLFDQGAITVREDLWVRVARTLAGSSARDLFKDLDGQAVRLPVDEQFYPRREHLRWHHAQVSRARCDGGKTWRPGRLSTRPAPAGRLILHQIRRKPGPVSVQLYLGAHGLLGGGVQGCTPAGRPKLALGFTKNRVPAARTPGVPSSARIKAGLQLESVAVYGPLDRQELRPRPQS